MVRPTFTNALIVYCPLPASAFSYVPLQDILWNYYLKPLEIHP